MSAYATKSSIDKLQMSLGTWRLNEKLLNGGVSL